MIASSAIDASLTTKSLTYRPGGPSVSFGVSVINRSSQFASFQLEILAAGANHHTDWYELSPEVSAAKSPGDRTNFQIDICNTPIPDFVGTVNLVVRVFSPQIPEEQRLVLRLNVEPRSNRNLVRLELPIDRFQVYPLNNIDIPVKVKNTGMQAIEVLLSCTELDPAWLIDGVDRRLRLEAQTEVIATFQCQPSGADQVPSRDYPFIISAREQSGFEVESKGVVEVLPVGFLQFEAQPQQQSLPAKWPWLPNWKARQSSFQLSFNNTSNLLQSIDLEVRGGDAKNCEIELPTEPVKLPLGTVTPVELKLTPKRPWIGHSRRLSFEVKPWLSDPRLGSSDPATQMLWLKVAPIIPLWLLMLVMAIMTAVIFRPTPISHFAGVNAVRLSGTSGRSPLVFSASDDCSVRSWSITSRQNLKAQGSLPSSHIATTCTEEQPRSPQGLLAVTQQAVRSLALVPVKNNQLFAGLENGDIQVWDINQGKSIYTLRDPKDKTSDRILDLVFTRNSLTLFSSYGSGKIRQWKRPQDVPFESKPATVLKLPKSLSFQVWGMALSANEKTLASAGQFKRLILWDVSKDQPKPQQLIRSKTVQRQGENDFFWDVDFAPEAPILAAADSDGFVTLWNSDHCQTKQKTAGKFLPKVHCEEQSQWQVSESSVRQIQFTPDQRWLISAGDNGQVQAWPLTSDMKLDNERKPQTIASLPHRVTSLDIISHGQGVWIATGSEDAQVHLHQFNLDP